MSLGVPDVEAWLVTTTVASEAVARQLAEVLVKERLAACVQVLGPTHSVYRWAGAVEVAAEYVLAIKTSEDRWPTLQSRLRALHPYELPELIAVRVAAGDPRYLSWLFDSTRE